MAPMKAPTWSVHPPIARQPAGERAGPRERLLTVEVIQRLVTVVAIAVLVFLAMLQLRTPAAVPSTAPETAFSADRAMVHLDVIASESRAIGLPGHDAARDYLVDQLELMGLEPQLQVTTGIVRFEGADSYNAGTVTNVVARIPGTGSTGAIALNAHYDGGSTGPAASDNGAGVVTVLETVRALLAGPALANDVIVVFTDGEENGDIGSAAFNQQHPWAQDVRLAINSEAQGSGGPAILYATSDDNGALTSTYLSVAPKPTAYSLLPELVRQLPGMRLACDLEDYLLNGSAGLGFVYASDTAAYHTERDSIATIDRGSIQQEGENTLAVVRHFGNENLTDLPVEPNRVFFTILPNTVVHYSGTLAVVFAALATLALAAIAVVGHRRGKLSLGGAAVGALAFLLGTLGTVALTTLLWIGLRALNTDYQVLLVGSYQADLNVVGITLAAIALMAALYVALQRRVRWESLTIGAAVVWTLLLWGATLALPGISYLLLWPLAFGLLPLAWAVFVRDTGPRPWARVAILVVALAPAIVLLPGTAYQAVALLNRFDYMAALGGSVALLGVWALFVAPLVALALPQIRLLSDDGSRLGRWAVPLATGLAAVIVFGWGMATSGFDAEHPRPNAIAYELDADAGAARWVSVDPALDSWTTQFFPDGAASGDYEIDSGFTVPAHVASAPVVDIEQVGIEVLSDTTTEGIRTVAFRLDSPREAAQLDVAITGGTQITAATIDGRALDLAGYAPASEGTLKLGYAGVTADGVEVTLAVRSAEPLRIEVSETTYGLPEVPGPTVEPRGEDAMPATGVPLDATVVRKTFTI
jgi:hypothetical protein